MSSVLSVSVQLKFYYATARLTNTYIERRFAKTLRVLAAPPFYRHGTAYQSVFKIGSITPPRSRGASPKEIQPSNQGISFGEKGAGKRKIEAQARFDVNFMASCRFDCFNSMKPYKRLEPRGSNGAVAIFGSVGRKIFCHIAKSPRSQYSCGIAERGF